MISLYFLSSVCSSCRGADLSATDGGGLHSFYQRRQDKARSDSTELSCHERKYGVDTMQRSPSVHEDIAELAFLWFFHEATNTDNEDNDIDTENGANFF